MRMELREYAYVPNVECDKVIGMKADPNFQREQSKIVGAEEVNSGNIKTFLRLSN